MRQITLPLALLTVCALLLPSAASAQKKQIRPAWEMNVVRRVIDINRGNSTEPRLVYVKVHPSEGNRRVPRYHKDFSLMQEQQLAQFARHSKLSLSTFETDRVMRGLAISRQLTANTGDRKQGMGARVEFKLVDKEGKTHTGVGLVASAPGAKSKLEIVTAKPWAETVPISLLDGADGVLTIEKVLQAPFRDGRSRSNKDIPRAPQDQIMGGSPNLWGLQ